jgi:hypothetical protein
MNETECQQPGPGSEFAIMRLMELILVEILRSEALRVNPEHTGLLTGLADPVTSRALSNAQRRSTWLDSLWSGPALRRLAIYLCRPVSRGRGDRTDRISAALEDGPCQG